MNITRYPVYDGMETTLSQARDGTAGTVHVNNAPSITLTSGHTTCIVVNPWKTNMQVVEVTAIDWSANTFTASWSTIARSPSENYISQSHQVWSKVIISDNYQFRADIVAAINSKLDTNTTDISIWVYADAAARDAAIPSPTNGDMAYLTSEGYWTDYISWSRQARATGATPNASETVSGTVEIATASQFSAGTATGETGATLVPTNSQVRGSLNALETEDTNLQNQITSNLITLQSNIDDVESTIPTVAAAQSQIKQWSFTRSAAWVQTIPHWLGKIPRLVQFAFSEEWSTSTMSIVWHGSYNWTTQKCLWLVYSGWSNKTAMQSYWIHYTSSPNYGMQWSVSFDSANITIARTALTQAIDLNVIRTAHA